MYKPQKNKCHCCQSENLVLKYEDSFFNSPVFKCTNCSYHFTQIDKSKFDIKNYYNETYWKIFRNINNEKITDQKTDDAYIINKLPKFVRNIIELIGIRKSLAYSQYNYLKPFLKGNNLFELGCGEGFILELFEKKGFLVHGIEPSKLNLKIINKKLRKGKCLCGFVEDITSFNKKFDVVIASHVLEHVEDCKKILYNLKNVISDLGILFIEVPNCGNKENLEHSIKTQPHIHHFTKQNLQKLVENFNFKVVTVDTFHGKVISIKDHFKYLIYWMLGRDFFLPASEYDGNYLRIIVTHADK